MINNEQEKKLPKKRGRKTINIDYERLEYLASLGMGTMSICRRMLYREEKQKDCREQQLALWIK